MSSSSLFNLEKQEDSIDAEEQDGITTPNRSIQKRRTRSYRKNSSNLLQLSAMVRSSNSSLCSFTSEITDGGITDGKKISMIASSEISLKNSSVQKSEKAVKN